MGAGFEMAGDGEQQGSGQPSATYWTRVSAISASLGRDLPSPRQLAGTGGLMAESSVMAAGRQPHENRAWSLRGGS